MLPIKLHSSYKRILAELKKSQHFLKMHWQGPAYRCVSLKWAHPEYLISGEGTLRYGGRWMQPNYCKVVHAASTEAIALKESRRVFDYYGIRKPANDPRVIVELDVRLKQLIDLTKLKSVADSPPIVEMLKEDWEKLNASRVETIAQAFGRAIHSLNYEGLIAPSSRDARGRNLVWFPKQLLPDSQIEIVGQEKLKQFLA